jgi:hypothetical protein
MNEAQQLGVGSLESACDRNDVKVPAHYCNEIYYLLVKEVSSPIG